MTPYSAFSGFKLDPSSAIVLYWIQVLLVMDLGEVELPQWLLSNLAEEGVVVIALLDFYDLKKR